MHARIERAVHAEQHAIAEHRFHAKVTASLQHLVAAIHQAPPVLAASPGAVDRDERNDDDVIAYWTKPELPRVVSALCELERLVQDRVSPAFPQRMGFSPPHDESTTAKEDAEHRTLYTALVGQLVSELVAPVMKSFCAASIAALAEPSSAGEGTSDVQVRFSTTAKGLFSHDGALRLPADVYVGWRCCSRLLDSFRRQLGVSEEDSGAGWLDAASAVLDGLHRTAFQISTAPAGLTVNGGDYNTMMLRMMTNFKRRAKVCARVAHCYWWWWRFTYAFGEARGWVDVASSSPPSTPSPTSKDDFLQLWCTGRRCATSLLSGVVLPTAAYVLQTSMAALVFDTDYNKYINAGGAAAAAASVRAQCVVDAVAEVRKLAADAFPHVDGVGVGVGVGAGAPTTSARGDNRSNNGAERAATHAACASAVGNPTPAVIGFVGLVVHDALRPLAERVLDDPAALLARAPAATVGPHTTTATVAAAAASQDGWDESDDGDWEEVPVLGSATPSVSPNVRDDHADAEKSSAAETARGSAVDPAETAVAAVTCTPSSSPQLSPPVITCVRDALVFVLDTLEAQCGQEMVRQDTIAMTLRRLL
ncbi:hypothetical protein ABB37_07218 [Leptomonas pyrrhocoris]|uniref:Uncharacterized protein n=1 Tax=Leptomonas pyrrhocoris TaxID=157538 RepID=A0A0M9FWE8_LEPPY|nr:hypothetical protein ABB37_07218 [Leptomonas pyrrhocoris]XP_015655776.1 hypothetical protein ABB37_07218 [Leptomonas pyrrhocoris]KPA77336.1 hypothetical protein ABB37_07218 [Leptomonas pyrrhocoris]KPA77337.1 hypothetical protein ABB37_07218 [Leptomonas pyrrhocoris]|eukprot:XP_015655775.1 hypothetical protein ABB37_07218 [Leptomonas pyrrhocoris]